MAEPYFERLSQLVVELSPLPNEGVTLETKHFFSGAALYANGKICATLSPAGFAIKLPRVARQRLINDRKGEEFRFFANGPIKREYVALSDLIIGDKEILRELVGKSATYAGGASN